MKVLYVAEIVGKAGIYAVKKGLPEACRRYQPDFVMACADGVTGGNGLGRHHAAYLRKLGVHALTTGECCFYKKDLTEDLGKVPYVLRPANLNPEAPGAGSRVFRAGSRGEKIAVAVLLGQSGFARLHGDNPFAGFADLVERLRRETPYVIIDFHAQATAEKHTLFALAGGGGEGGDGSARKSCSAVIGSHTRVQTADARVLPGGIAVITDAGRTGSIDSVGGADAASRIAEYLSGIPDWTKDAWARPELQGVFLDLAPDGSARSVERVRVPVPDAPRAAGEASGNEPPGDANGSDESPEAAA